MNKGKHPLSQKLRKLIAKEIHKALVSAPKLNENELQDRIDAEALIKKYHMPRAAMAHIRKEIETKLKKSTASHSKRTTPGKVNEGTTPDHAKKEGSRWHHNIDKQNVLNAKRLTRKTNKRNQFRNAA